MAERRTTRRRQRDDDTAEEYDEDLPEDTDGQASDSADVDDDPAGEPEADQEEPQAAHRPRSRSKPRAASPSRRQGLTAAQAAQAGLQQLAELTGKRPESVTQVQPAGEAWTIGVEVVEDRRIPSSTDLLGLYEIDIDESGDLQSYRRIKRYSRGRGDDGGDS